MKKFNVVIHYEGGWSFEIEANDEEAAKEIAEEMFADIPDMDLIANLADVFIDDCWEVE
jgi:hypothetical protein